MTAIYKPLILAPEIIEIEADEQALCSKLGAKRLTAEYFAPGMVMLLDADWQKKRLRLNSVINGVAYHGPMILCNTDGERFCSLDHAKWSLRINWPEYYKKHRMKRR